MISNFHRNFAKQVFYPALILLLLNPVGVLAAEEKISIDWRKLNLSSEQESRIKDLDREWQSNWSEVKPTLVDEQKRLAKLLTTYDSDSVEIMALQQSIAQKREKLIACATTNYLKKRQLLTENQQHELSAMMNQSIAARQHGSQEGLPTDALPDHIQGLMEKARNIWPSQGEH
jgi:Spy/CpxP family protein refolding chaperone